MTSPRATPPSLYDRTAARASRAVLATYSTSFGAGSRLLGERMRRDIEAVYGLVRVADEVVDTHRGATAGDLLDALEEETALALERGYSTNLIVHAFARTARRVGIGHAEIDPFFASMRMDLTVSVHDKASYEQYVFGSAEVVGLMCLAVFLNADRRPDEPLIGGDARLVRGARALGAAFQKINFLRDLRTDVETLGRSYLPGVTPQSLSTDDLDAILAEIGADVQAAREALPYLPRRPRIAVASTLALYERLLTKLAATSPAELLRCRVRVPDAEKVLVVARVVVRSFAPGADRAQGGAA
ncbi:phytoene/squalene synthase family protein [Oerskovia flava]|uniref:phytoene/squalene synthase family protein n=1 Tax=Oerskovia flava TaxID=2986422 RepID=UPI00224058A8|nr:phytoene/squalene synthase family protein [Oerskovia sp. JB1-3-2]